MITDHIPYPPSSGTSIRNYNLLSRIAEEHDVWVAAFARSEEDRDSVAHMLKFCKGVETVEVRRSGALERPLEALRYLFLGRPIELRHYQSQELVEKIQCLTSKIDFDVVDIVDSYMGLYLEVLRPELRRRTVLTFIDVVFSTYDRISRLEPGLPRKLRTWLYSRMMRRWEPYYVERFARCIAVSEADRRLLLSSNPGLEIDVVPNGIDTKQYRPLPLSGGGPALLFVGNMEYRPNIDAMLYFCRDVFPRIRAVNPGVTLWITGLNPSQEIQDLANDGIYVTGSVDDVRSFYEQCTVCVVPLRAGGGTRLKILEAMALGRPVVSTSIGCEGLGVVDGEHLFIADTPEQFAEKTLRLLDDHDLRQHIIGQARSLVVKHYDWDVIAQQLLKTYVRVAQ
ncbi:MAG: glycosyltransferase [Chloroflexi bacterium]|nr:glycosyltransferase [Chloroflexota bacterium]